MFNSFLHGIAKVFVTPLIFIMGLAGYPLNAPTSTPNQAVDIQNLQQQISYLQNNQSSQALGGTNVLPQNIAFFQTSLAIGISSTANSMSLVQATYNNGASTLASSTYAFVIDEGTVTQEMVQADCTATVCTNMTRGLDFLNGTSTVASLQFSHRRGASVKITTAPTTLIMGNILAGTDSLPVPIKYAATISTTTIAADRNNVASAGLVADVAFAGAGIINASTAAKGVVQIATKLQSASSTLTGSSGAPLVIPAVSATSSYSTNSTGLNIVATDNNNYIDGRFINTLPATTTFSSTASSSMIVSATSTLKVGSFPIWSIGKQSLTFSASGSFKVPWGISVVCEEMVGAGGGGGSSNGTSNGGGGGGGGGGYGRGCFDVSATSTIVINIGALGTGGNASVGVNGGTTNFGGFMTCTGGQGGGRGTAGSGGTQGSCTATTTGATGVFTIAGQPGGVGSAAANVLAGTGGSSFWGYGGLAAALDTILAGTGFGSGGTGTKTSDTSEENGGAGTPGYLIVTW